MPSSLEWLDRNYISAQIREKLNAEWSHQVMVKTNDADILEQLRVTHFVDDVAKRHIALSLGEICFWRRSPKSARIQGKAVSPGWRLLAAQYSTNQLS
jgi:hypothetical protein